MVDLYKQAEQPLTKLDNFKSFDVNGQEVTNVIPSNNPLYGLPPDQQEAALAELQKPPTGEELAYALAQNPNFEKAMTTEEFLRYDDYMKTVETDWIEGIMTGAGMVVDEIGNGLSAMYNDDEKLKRAIPTLAEGFARGTRDMYGLVAQSADPQSPFFKFKELMTGSGSPEERFRQFKEARDFNRRSLEIMEGKANVTDIDPDLINPQVAQALSYIADPSWALPFVGQAGKAMGISMKSIGLAKLSEQIAVVGAFTENAKRMAFGGMLKVAGAPLNLLGDATMQTIEWGADKAAGAFEFATGMAYQDARRIVRDAGLYGGTVFRVPYMSTISDSYLAGFGAKGLGETLGIMGEVIMGRKRGVYSYAEEALAAGKDVLSPQAKAMLRILNQADPILSYGYAAIDGMTEGALVGAALGYGSARGEGAAQGIGMGAVMGAGGALMGRGWAGMAREGGIIHQRVLTELEFVKNAMKDIDPDKLAKIETLQELASLHGQDLSWQILGMLKLVPDLKLEILDSVGFEQLRRSNQESARALNGEDANDPLVGLDLNDPDDIKKLKRFMNFEGMVVQSDANGQVTLLINSDHYKKYTFGHELFHGIMRSSPMADEFIKDMREKLLGRVTEDGIEMPGVIEPSKMRSFMERYIKAVYSNNPEQLEQRMKSLDAAIKAYEKDGTLIPGQDPKDARPVLDILVEEAGAYYFSHMINGKDMDFLYRGGDLGGLRQVIDDAKEGLRNFFEAKFAGAGMDFEAARTLHEAFLKGGVDGGKRIRIGALDALMTDIVRQQAGTQEGRSINLGDMNGEQQRRFRDRHGLGDVLQPRKNGGMDTRRRTAAEESARAKQIVDVLRGMNQSERTSITIVEKNGDVTIYGDLSNAELLQLVRVGAMLPTEAARYRMFRDAIANKGKGVNVFGGTYVGESYEVGEGASTRRLRRSKGDRVPVTHREFVPIEMRTEIKLTKNGKGKATFVMTGLDIKNADMRLRELWFREDVQRTWGGDYNAFAADFYRYLENISDPNGVPSAEHFGGGQSGSYKRNVFHEAFGAAMREGETPFHEPSPTYKGAAGRGEKFVIYSMSLGSMYDVKLRDRNVPYNHSIAYERIRRNWSPSEMGREVLPDGEKLTHEESGYSFVKGPNGKWRAYDKFRRVIGIAEDAAMATEIGRKAYIAEQARQAKEIKNLSVNEKTEITAKGWAPVFFSAVEKFVKSGAITPNMHPEQVWARISKASFAGIRADELRYLGLKERILGKDNAHLQNARDMDKKVQELFTYSQRFASQDPAKLARVQEVAAKLRKAQQEEYKKGVEMQRKEQAADSLAIGKPIGQAGLDVINKHIQERAFGLRMTDEGTNYSSYVADGAREDDSYVILTARSNQRTGVSGHFGDDVIVHIRVDIRTDPNTGERVLVIHEIQANNAEDTAAAKTPEQIRVDIRTYEEAIKVHEHDMKNNKEVVSTRAHRLASELRIDSSGNSAIVGYGVWNDRIVTIAQSRYERQRIAVTLQNVKDMLANLGNGPFELGARASISAWVRVTNVSLVFTPEVKELVRKKLEFIQSTLLEMLIHAEKKNEFPSYGAGDDRYIVKKLLTDILNNSPFQSGYNNLRRSYKLADYEPLVTSLGYAMHDTMGAEVAILGEALRSAYIAMSHEQRKSLFKLDDEGLALFNKEYSNRITENNLKRGNEKEDEALIWAYTMSRTFSLGTIVPNDLYNYMSYLDYDNQRISNTRFTGDFIQRIARQLVLGSDGDYGPLVDLNLRRVSINRYEHITDMAGRDILEASVEAINDGKFLNENYQFMANDPRVHRLQKTLSEHPTGKLSDSALGYVRNFALLHLSQQVIDSGRAYLDNTHARDDAKSKIQKLKLELGSKTTKLIAQTPQDWVVMGIKMAMRHAAEKGIRTIYLTDAMGGPAKCGMDYMSATAHYDIAVPNLTNGFLRQYGLKVEMPVQQKRYELHHNPATDETVAIGTATGVSWQEQLGYKPRFKSSTHGGKRKYRVDYVEPAGKMPFNEQDIQKAQMKNMARFTMSDEVAKIALDEGFRNLSPSEKPITDLGKEVFVTGKKKFEKAIGLYFRERGTGRIFQLEHASNDASYAYFYPVDLRREEAALGDNPTPEQSEAIRQRILAERKVIRHDQGMGGLGFRGIDDKVNAAFESYSKTEPGKEPTSGNVDTPTFDTSAIKANGEAIKDALTSLEGLSLTKDQTFQLFGRNTRKGREPGIIDNINSEISKAQRGEEPNVEAIESHIEELEALRDELQEKQENTPENFQDSDAYQNREEVIDAINETIDEVRGLMEPPKGGNETRNMSPAENVGAIPDEPYRSAADVLSTMELWAVAAKAGKHGPAAKINHKLITPEVLNTVEWFLTNDNSRVTRNRPKSFATIAEALKWVQETALKEYRGPNKMFVTAKDFKDAFLATSAVLGEPTRKKKGSNVEPNAKDGASFDDWFDWARKKRVNGKSVATARNALKFISEMPSEGYYRAVAQMLLAMGSAGMLDTQIYLTGRGFMRYSGSNVGKLAISKRAGGKSDAAVSLAGRLDNPLQSTVGVVIEEVMHGAQMTGANYAPMKILKGLGSKGVTWKLGAMKLISSVEADVNGKTYAQLTPEMKDRLIAARLAKLILESTKGIEVLKKDSDKVYDLHEALFGNVVSANGVWRNEGDPSRGGGAGAVLRLRFQTKEQVGTKNAREVNGYHFGNVAEFLVGLFSDPNLARFYFDKPPVDLSSLTPKGDPLRTSWRNLASQMISVAISFFNGLFRGEKKNVGSQFIEETVVMLQRQAEAAKNKDPAREIDVQIGTNEVGFPQKPMKKPVGLRGKTPLPSEGPINMGQNDGETGLATIDGQGATRGNEVGPAVTVVDGQAKPIPRRGRPQLRIGQEEQSLPAQQYAYPIPAGPTPIISPVWSTGDATAGKSILTSTAGYMVMLINGKWRVYNPEKEIIGVFNDEQKAKDLADRRALRK